MRQNNTTEAHNRQRMLEYEIKHGVEVSSIGDTFPLKRAVKGRCKDFRSKAKKILPDLDCVSMSVHFCFVLRAAL